MDLEELRTVREQERRTDSLQHLRDSFYDDATEYVRELKRERSRRAEAAGDPYAPEAMRLTDEIDTAAEVIESLYERRRGKVVKLASFAAAGMPAETEGMTDQERTMFDDLVERIEANEDEVLGRLEDVDVEGEATSVPETDPPAMGGGDATPTTPSDTAETTGEEPTHVIGDPTGTEAESEPGTPTTATESMPEDAPPAPPAEAAPGAETTTAADAAPNTAEGDDLGTAPESPSSSEDGGVLADAMGGDAPAATESEPSGGADAASGAGASGADAASGASAPSGVNAPSGASAESTADTSASDATGGTTGGSTSADTTETPATTATPSTPTDSDDGIDRPTAEAAVAAGGPDAATDSSAGGSVPTEDPAGTGGSTATGSSTVDSSTTETATTERTTVRVTTDVGEIFGVDDRAYDLQTDDVVHLPTANAEPLLQQDAAEPLE